MIQDYVQFWTKFLKFEGRTNQRGYLVPIIVNGVFDVILFILSKMLLKPDVVPVVSKNVAAYQQTTVTAGQTPVSGVVFTALFVGVTFVFLIGSLSLHARRLRDVGFNPIYALGVLIPIVNFIAFVYLAITPSLGFSESPEVKMQKRFNNKNGKAPTFPVENLPSVKINSNQKVSWQKKITSKKLSAMFIELRYTDAEWNDRIQKRIVFTFTSLIMTMVISSFVKGSMNKYVVVGGLALAIFAYYDTYAKIKRSYRNYIFAKQVEFSKFMRTVIPYLMNKNERSFISVLEIIVNRMKVEQNLNLRKKVYSISEVVSTSVSDDIENPYDVDETPYDDHKLFDVDPPVVEPEPILNSYIKNDSIDLMDSDTI